MTVTRQQLAAFCNDLLAPERYDDYGPNGLQIEGDEEIETIAFAVSATRDSVDSAIARDAQALVVHHGLFWNFHGPRTLTGPFGRRVCPLVRHGVNLYAYHLPLDGHPEVGNAACIGRDLGMHEMAPFGDHKGMATGIKGRFANPPTVAELRSVLAELLQHPVILSSDDQQHGVRTLGIITGGANSGWKDAAAEGLDAYLTGEISEHDWHEAKEAGVHMFAGGHHATEVFGIRALMARIDQAFDVTCVYIDSSNPA